MKIRYIYLNGELKFEKTDDECLVTVDKIYCRDVRGNTDAEGVELRQVEDSMEFDLHVNGNIRVTKNLLIN